MLEWKLTKFMLLKTLARESLKYTKTLLRLTGLSFYNTVLRKVVDMNWLYSAALRLRLILSTASL